MYSKKTVLTIILLNTQSVILLKSYKYYSTLFLARLYLMMDYIDSRWHSQKLINFKFGGLEK